MNQVNIIGNIGQAPVLKNGKFGGILSFSVAVNETRLTKDGKEIKFTTWIKCVAYGLRAEAMAKRLDKGTLVHIGGKLVNNEWTKQDGTKVSSMEVEVNTYRVFSQTARQETAEPVDAGEYLEEIPFEVVS